MQFTYSSYADLMAQLRTQNYSIIGYEQAGLYDKEVILRHDVDSDLEKALQLAKLEHSLGVCSTYFILLTSPHYNILARSSTEIIHDIASLGHAIGLHFDEVNYPGLNQTALKAKICQEADTMESFLNLPIRSVSMHRPSQQTLSADYVFKNRMNSYSSTFFHAYKYVSDSRMHWREDVETIVASGDHPKLHILTHPFWYAEAEQTIHDAVFHFCQKANAARYDTLADNMRDLPSALLRTELEI